MKHIPHPCKQVRIQSAWPHYFADAYGGVLTKRQWWIVIIGFILLHLLALQVSLLIGCFEPNPNQDHIEGMWQVLRRGYPNPIHVPPGFSYYLAFKWIITQALGLPYWSAKYFIDILFVFLSGILTVLLGQALTKNRFLAIISGFGLVCAPIYILGVAMEEAGVFMLPFFLSSLLLLVKELQRQEGPRLGYFAAAGATMGVASLIRGNPQFIFIVIVPFVFWFLHKSPIRRWRLRAIGVLSTFCLTQALVMLPWSLVQKKAGLDGITAYPSIYASYFWSVKRQTGNKISDWLCRHYEEPQRSLKGVVDFNLKWLKKDPAALFELCLLKTIRAWYISDSGRWDKFLLITHLPFWIFALLGVWRWCQRVPADPACIFILIVILYMWAVSAIAGGIARHISFIYGFIGMLDAVFLLSFLKRD